MIGVSGVLRDSMAVVPGMGRSKGQAQAGIVKPTSAKTVGECILRPRRIFPSAELQSSPIRTPQLLWWGKMPREAEISVNERAFIQQALQEQIRLDGRAFDAFRPLELTFGDEYGVADVQLGKTRCAV